jgi:Flp pilus assembly protein TadG
MKRPIVSQLVRSAQIGRTSLMPRERGHERGVTLLLVALAMVAIIGMAALAIDVVTLYLAREEAQRAADTGAIAAARIISISGVTGDPNNNNVSGSPIVPWTTACNLAQEVAQTVADQNSVNSQSGTVNVTFLYNGTAVPDCSISGGTGFGLNPQVQVQVIRSGMPSLFSRIWGSTGNSISATATAEVYNSSDSGTYTATGDIVPVGPRCVKPWVIPNLDPAGSGGQIVNPLSGGISNPGIMISTSPAGTGIIGEQITLTDACNGAPCPNMETQNAVYAHYIPALISSSPLPIGVPSCSNGSDFQEAIGGCDVATSYACGTPNGAQLDFTVDRYSDTDTAVNCLTQSGDTFDNSTYPFQIRAGPSNPYTSTVGQPVSVSSSVVTIPIFNGTKWPSASNNQPPTTIVGFLQVFLQAGPISGGLMNATVLNVVGCGAGGAPTASYSINGTSPVPIRLITPP